MTFIIYTFYFIKIIINFHSYDTSLVKNYSYLTKYKNKHYKLYVNLSKIKNILFIIL